MEVIFVIIIAVIGFIHAFIALISKNMLIYVVKVLLILTALDWLVNIKFLSGWLGWLSEYISIYSSIFGGLSLVFGIARLWDYIDSKREPKVYSAKQQVTGKVFQEIIKALFR